MSLPDRFHISTLNNAVRFRTEAGAWSDITLASTVAAESAYPLTNMQNEDANDWAVIDMTGQTTVAITDSGSANVTRDACLLIIQGHNCPRNTTVRLRLYDAIDQGGSVVYDSTALNIRNTVPVGSTIAGFDPIEGDFEDEGQMKPVFSLFFDDPADEGDLVAYKSFRIDITCADGFTDDTLKIDKLWLSWAYCPEHGPERGFGSTLIDDSEHQRKPGGGMETVEGDVRRSLNGQFRIVENYERHVIRHLLDRAKMGGDIVVTMDPNDTQSMKYETTFIGRRMNEQTWENEFYNGNRFGFAVEEN